MESKVTVNQLFTPAFPLMFEESPEVNELVTLLDAALNRANDKAAMMYLHGQGATMSAMDIVNFIIDDVSLLLGEVELRKAVFVIMHTYYTAGVNTVLLNPQHFKLKLDTVNIDQV